MTNGNERERFEAAYKEIYGFDDADDVHAEYGFRLWQAGVSVCADGDEYKRGYKAGRHAGFEDSHTWDEYSQSAAPTPERAQCKLCNSTGHETPCAYPTEINRQQAETVQKLKEGFERAEKDAANYRWLKQRLKMHSSLDGIQVETWFDGSEFDLDTLIAAAILAANKGAAMSKAECAPREKQNVMNIPLDAAAAMADYAAPTPERADAEKDATLNLLREIALLKRHDPNGQNGYATTWFSMFVRPDLMDRIDAILVANNEGK
jgi:hypothetical protein